MTERLRIAAMLYLLAQTLLLGVFTCAAALLPAPGDALALTPLAALLAPLALLPAAWALAAELGADAPPSRAAAAGAAQQGHRHRERQHRSRWHRAPLSRAI